MKKNKFIKTVSSFLAVTMLFTSNIYAAENISLKIDGVLQLLDNDSKVVDENLLVNVSTLTKALGVTMSYSNNGNTVTIKKDKKTLVINSSSDDVTVNGAKLKMPTPAVKEKQIFYVPARFVAQTLGAKVSWIEKTKTIVVDTGKTEINILNLKERINDKTIVFTYKQGLETAVKNNNSLKNIKDSEDIIKENIDDAKDAETMAAGMRDRRGVIEAQRLQKQLDFEERNIKQNKIVLEDSIEQLYRTYLSSVMQSELDLILTRENIELEKINVRNMTLKNELGMESDFNLNQAKEKLKQLESQKSNLEISMKNAREALNLYLGLSRDTDLFIDYNVKYTPVDTSVERHIATVMDEDPQLIIENRQIEYARYVEETSESIMNESRLKLETDITKLERQHADTISNYRKALYNTYNSMKQLEESRKSTEIDSQIAKNEYNKGVANYETGLITVFEVQSLKLKLLQNEITLVKNQFDYDNLKFTYQRPYLLK